MADRQPIPIDGSPSASSDWPTLIERAVDDVSRILRSEAHMLETSLGAALQLQIANTIGRLMIVAAMLSGAICILFASILLLHQWLPWWQAFGLVGLTMLVAGIIINATAGPRSGIAA
jgi:hypothetical protein